jgi:hypothetical protein
MVHGPDEAHRPSGTRTAHCWRLAAGGGLFAFVDVDADGRHCDDHLRRLDANLLAGRRARHGPPPLPIPEMFTPLRGKTQNQLETRRTFALPWFGFKTKLVLCFAPPLQAAASCFAISRLVAAAALEPPAVAHPPSSFFSSYIDPSAGISSLSAVS